MEGMALPCMVAFGNQVIAVAGFEVFLRRLHDGAPRCLNLNGAGHNSPLVGSTMGVYTDRMQLAILNISGLQLFQISDAFIHLADVGLRVIIPFLIRYNPTLVPQGGYFVREVFNKHPKFFSGMQKDSDSTLCCSSSPCLHHTFAHSFRKSSNDWRCECKRVQR